MKYIMLITVHKYSIQRKHSYTTYNMLYVHVTRMPNTIEQKKPRFSSPKN